MNSSNLLTLNDWPITKALRIIFIILISACSLIYCDIIGLHIPLLRQIIVSIFLLFIPGILILRILRIHNHSSIEIVLYSLGLSISTIMFSGFFINSIYPIIGIQRPFSLLSLVITFSLIIFLLGILSYIADKEYGKNIVKYNASLFKPQLLFLFSLPIITALATYFFEKYNNNSFTLILLFILACIPFLVSREKFLSKDFYPICIFSVAISLLLHITLISNHITGFDINVEYYFANLTAYAGMWDLSYPSNVNSMLSITILAPILSIIMGIDLVWVFKLMYPLIFSFVPVGIYLIVEKQTNEKIAFFSSFFFISTFMFYAVMTQLARQQIGEFFIILFILALFDDKLNHINRTILCLIFCLSLAVSHYALNYIFLFGLILALLIIAFLDLFGVTFTKRLEQSLNLSIKLPESYSDIIDTRFLILLLVFTISWYINISSSSPFGTIVRLIDNVISNISGDLLDPMSREMATVLVDKFSITRELTKYLFIFFNISIIIGVIYIFFDKVLMRIRREYLAFSLAFLFFWIMSAVLPNFAMWFTSRLYQITLLFLTPFGIVGLILVFGLLFKSLHIEKVPNNKILYTYVSFFLFVFLLLNSQAASSVINDDPKSIALNYTVDSARFNDQEVISSRWISKVADHSIILGDAYASLLLLGFAFDRVGVYSRNFERKNAFIFLRNHNIIYKNMLDKNGDYYPLRDMSYHNLLYNNMYSKIYI